ncbi:hypothetical protein KJ830_10075 [bacterium]|nr:hypothetical protein [bacterium]
MGFFKYSIGNAFRDFFTWLFSKHYYSRANEYFGRLNAIYSKEISKLSKVKFDIKHDEKGMPIKIVFISGKVTLNTNVKGKLEVVKTKATNKDN